MAAATACGSVDASCARLPALDGATARHWRMQRNCALAPQQVLAMYAALCVLHVLIGGAFCLLGYAAVALWALAELLGIAWALLCYAQHACDRETLVLAH